MDNYLEEPNVNFNFLTLDEIYDRGLDEFVKSHHKDLFSMIDSFHNDILPKFNELSVGELMEKLFDIASQRLKASLPREVVASISNTAHDLAKTINPYYIIPDLLTGRDEEAEKKTEECILKNISQIYPSLSVYAIKEQLKETKFDEISQSLIEKAKPETAKLIEAYKELKEQNDKEVKEKLLPLLQKYISNPI